MYNGWTSNSHMVVIAQTSIFPCLYAGHKRRVCLVWQKPYHSFISKQLRAIANIIWVLAGLSLSIENMIRFLNKILVLKPIKTTTTTTNITATNYSCWIISKFLFCTLKWFINISVCLRTHIENVCYEHLFAISVKFVNVFYGSV